MAPFIIYWWTTWHKADNPFDHIIIFKFHKTRWFWVNDSICRRSWSFFPEKYSWLHCQPQNQFCKHFYVALFFASVLNKSFWPPLPSYNKWFPVPGALYFLDVIVHLDWFKVSPLYFNTRIYWLMFLGLTLSNFHQKKFNRNSYHLFITYLCEQSYFIQYFQQCYTVFKNPMLLIKLWFSEFGLHAQCHTICSHQSKC